ncbi:MAG TPA: ribonuclease H-like domain-containing protein [Candidatus Paceibacterota bacterium]|jgi:DEAD/DEAH box helicase domain-containing protein
MKVITFDIETRNTTSFRGRLDASGLELTVVGVHDSETDEYTSYLRDELNQLWPLLERAYALVGYNSDAFDIPILNRYYPGDLSRIRSVDIMVEVQKVLGRRLRLDSLAQATLGRGKSGDGLKAVEWWEQGLFEKVREYCIEDVRLTRQLFDHALKKGSLKYKDLREVREIKLDTSSWLAPAESGAMTHTLPF